MRFSCGGLDANTPLSGDPSWLPQPRLFTATSWPVCVAPCHGCMTLRAPGASACPYFSSLGPKRSAWKEAIRPVVSKSLSFFRRRPYWATAKIERARAAKRAMFKTEWVRSEGEMDVRTFAEGSEEKGVANNTWRERRAVAFRRTNSDEVGRKSRLAGDAKSCKAANFRLAREVMILAVSMPQLHTPPPGLMLDGLGMIGRAHQAERWPWP